MAEALFQFRHQGGVPLLPAEVSGLQPGAVKIIEDGDGPCLLVGQARHGGTGQRTRQQFCLLPGAPPPRQQQGGPAQNQHSCRHQKGGPFSPEKAGKVHWAHGVSSSPSGRSRVTQVPRPGSLSMESSLPWAAAMAAQRLSPSPLPPLARVRLLSAM